MTAPVPPTREPDTSARTCPGDQIGPCSTCRRPTHKYGAGARSPLCEYCDAYFGGASSAIALRTVFLAIPSFLAIDRTGICSAR